MGRLPILFHVNGPLTPTGPLRQLTFGYVKNLRDLGLGALNDHHQNIASAGERHLRSRTFKTQM